MSDQETIQRYLQNYIDKNKDTYTRDALTEKLVDAGYSVADIDDAYDALGLGWDEGAKRIKVDGKRNTDWRSVRASPLGVLIYFPGVPILIFLLGGLVPNIAGLLFLVALGAGLIVPRYVKRRNPALAKGLMYGYRTFVVLFVILPVVAGIALFGVCMVMYANAM